MSTISLNPDDLEVTSFAAAPGDGKPELGEAAWPSQYPSCQGTCNGCTSLQYAC